MIGADSIYPLAGGVVGTVAVLDLRDRTNPRRFANAVFWGAYAITLVFGGWLPDFVSGCLVIVLALVGGVRGLDPGKPPTTSDDERRAGAALWKNKLFVPALLVPALTLGGSVALRRLGVVAPKDASLVALSLAAGVALVVAMVTFRQPLAAPARECRRLLGLVGWAAVLPQMLAALGVIFAAAGVGDRIAELLGRFVPLDNRFVVVCAFTFGMALFTMVMGNAFAAFPVMTAAIGVPIIVRRFGGDPAVMASIGMLSGFCGTLVTPMAANFNVVPAALLELPDKNGVIRVQAPTAVMLLVANTLLLYVLAFRR